MGINEWEQSKRQVITLYSLSGNRNECLGPCLQFFLLSTEPSLNYIENFDWVFLFQVKKPT